MSEWFVASNGITGNTGTINSPWDLTSACSGHSGSITAGDTVWLLGAGHSGSGQTYTGAFTISVDGSLGTGLHNRDGKILFRNYNNERVTIDTGANPENHALTFGCDYVWVWGIEITNSDTNPGDNDAGNGIRHLTGTGNKIINCIIHDNCGTGIGAGVDCVNLEAYGNVLWYQGKTPQAGPNYNYNFYIQNQSPSTAWFKNNIALFCYGNYPVHCYGSEVSHLENMEWIGNAGTNGSVAGNWWLYGGGVVVTNCTIQSNYGASTDNTNGVFDLGWKAYGNGTSGCVVTNNYWMHGKISFHLTQTNLTCTGNTFYGELDGFQSTDYPDNTYYTTSPGNQIVVVQANTYEAGRGHVIVYTFSAATTASVDLSSILNVGDTYEIRDAQNYYGTLLTSGIYAGGSVSISVTGTEISSPTFVPTGRSTPQHTSKEFNAWVVIRTAEAAESTIRLAYRLS